MKYGYARVSTEGQDLANQIDRLKAAGCGRIFHEKRSARNADRPQLQRMLRALRPGDILVAVNADRLARDPHDMLTIIKRVGASGAGVTVLDEPFIDTTSEMSDLIVFVVGWAAKWHRRRILENTAAGRARARANGVKFGRKPKLNMAQRGDVLRRRAAGQLPASIAKYYRVSTSTIRRVKTL